MWEEVVKAYFKDYIINDGDIIPHYNNPKYKWARFDVSLERRFSHTLEKLNLYMKTGKCDRSSNTIFDLICRVIFVSDDYECIEKAFKRYKKDRFDLAEIDTVEINGKTYHVIWD